MNGSTSIATEGTTRRIAVSSALLAAASTLVVASLIAPETAIANGKNLGACTRSAKEGSTACRFDVLDDFFEARAICANEPTRDDRTECRQ